MLKKAVVHGSLFALLITTFAFTLVLLTEHVNSLQTIDVKLPAIPSYIAPKPGAQLVSPQTTIAIRYGVPLTDQLKQTARFVVTGSRSGLHMGHNVLADDQQTLIFVPDQPFSLHEVIYVNFNLGIDAATDVTFHFTTSSTDPAAYRSDNMTQALITEMQVADTHTNGQVASIDAYHTLPTDFPQITATTSANGVDAGYLFMSNFQFPGCSVGSYLLILDNIGEPLFYRPLPPCVWATDFKRQNNGLLTYWDTGTGIFHALDNSYTEVDTFQAGHGYPTDNHELQILANGHALLMIYDTQVISNSNEIIPNGRPTATVAGLVIQELDVAKNVVFEWRSWDHFLITDSVDLYLQTTDPTDYVHGNAIESDSDDNLLISSRHMNEITKIDRQTGDVIWRLGGKRNQFTFVGDNRPFSHQHDIRRLPNGNITLFDNGNFLTPSYSRAIEYRLDETNKTATLVREIRNTPDTYGFAMGSQQRLPNKNVLVGWGASSIPAMTEFSPDGTKIFELALAPPNWNYRAFRFGWQGYPTTQPTLVAITDTVPSLYYSWNGATEILGYRVYGGTTTETTSLIDTTFKTGFETKTILGTTINTFCYFRVMPIDKQGHETRYSNLVFIESPACQSPPPPTNDLLLFLPIISR